MLSISYDSCKASTTSADEHWETIAEDGENEWWYLPNGVIVLVDEDVEAYLNGTLVFYDRDKLPEVQ